MQEYSQAEERSKKINKASSSNSSSSIHKCIDQVFKKNKYRGKYVKISIEKKNALKEWLSQSQLKNSQPTSNDFLSISQTIEEPLENVQKWYRNQKKTNKEIKKGVSKTKRILSKDEEEILEKAFRNNVKPKPEKYKELAKKICINSKQIRKWFKYRRRKLKKLYNEGVPMPSSTIKGKTIDSSESSYKSSNSSPNLSTNDLKSQKNTSSDSNQNHLHKAKENMANNQQEKASQKQEEETNNSGNNKQQAMNIQNNFNNMYQNQTNMNMGQNYPQMFFTYPMVQTNIEPPQHQQVAIPIISQNNIYRIIQNAMTPLVYMPNNNQQSPFYVNNNGFQQAPVNGFQQAPVNGFQQAPVLIKGINNVPNYGMTMTQQQPHIVVMNNRNGSVNNEIIKSQNDAFENISSDKGKTFCFMNQNKPVQISNNNQNLFNNIIYLKQNNEAPGYVPNQNMMPNLNLFQNLQILQPQNPGYCINPNGFQQTFTGTPYMNNMNNGVYQMNTFNNQNMNMKMNGSVNNSSEKMQNYGEDHKIEENRD